MEEDTQKNLINNDKEFILEMAEIVWLKVKGYPIPDCYSERDREEIFSRYWHRAMEKEEV